MSQNRRKTTYFNRFSNNNLKPPIVNSRKPQFTRPVKSWKPELHENSESLGRWHLTWMKIKTERKLYTRILNSEFDSILYSYIYWYALFETQTWWRLFVACKWNDCHLMDVSRQQHLLPIRWTCAYKRMIMNKPKLKQWMRNEHTTANTYKVIAGTKIDRRMHSECCWRCTLSFYCSCLLFTINSFGMHYFFLSCVRLKSFVAYSCRYLFVKLKMPYLHLHIHFHYSINTNQIDKRKHTKAIRIPTE